MGKLTVMSYTVAHYGVEYLAYALKSVYEQVDQLHVIYTPHPSHGSKTDLECPETKEQLFNAAISIDTRNKVNWYEVDQFWDEGPQRDYAVELCKQAGADIILVVDCDEIWNRITLEFALQTAINKNKARNWLVNMGHFWRSFDWICYDDNWPVRIIDLRHNDGTEYIPRDFGRVYHFGYAVRSDIMIYKWGIHGHRMELRKNWFEEKWNQWPPPKDCHPTNEKGFWNPEYFKKKVLPKFMESHPFWSLELIE